MDTNKHEFDRAIAPNGGHEPRAENCGRGLRRCSGACVKH